MFFIKHRLAVLATSMLLAPMASAHISFWHPAMYGFCDGGNGKSDYCINTSNPVTPLAQLSFGGTKGQGWWYHGNLDQPPADGEFIELPVGGSITMELACNKAQTQWQPNDGVTIPLLACDSPAVLHNADAILSPTGPPTYHTRGCALAIAYESDQYKTQPEDFVIISTNRTCPFWHFTDFQIPSDLPACPEGGCNAFWLWIHEAGDYGGQSYQMYLSPFRAKVTGATNTAPLPSPRVSRKCVGAPEYCVKGPKQPHYWSQLERNNIYQNSNDPPYYNEDYGMMDGAQTDLYADVSNNTDAGTTVGYENIGCWSDNPDPDRVLDGMEYVVLNNMTPELCTLRCSGANYTYAGTQNGDTCYCGNSLEGSNSLSDSSCQTPCTGNSSETCGGGYANGIWALTANLPESQTVWEPLGCFGDPSGRLMGTPVAQTSTMSYAACRRQCAFDGYDIAGLENGYICLCANSIPASSVVDDSLCNVPCQGNSSEACGSYYSLSAFSLKHGLTATVSAASNSWSSVGCMTDSSTRTLEGSTITNNMMTNAACIEACDSTGYTYAGTEAGYQCFCSNEIAATGLVAASSDCYQPCWGNSTDKCGGDYRVSVFSKAAEIPVDSTIVSNFTSLGCWSEGSGTNRILDGEVFSSGTMTPDQCISKCGTDGYVYAALNGGYTCQCGNTIYSTSELQLDSVCTTACGGDSTKICGGTNSASLYGSGSKIGSTSSFTNVGCWVSNGNGTTTLSGSSSSSSTMTPGLCQARCAIDGYSFAGVQENECYCGNSMGVSSLIKSDFCNTPCSGNGTDFCGGYYAMSLFQSTTATAAALPAAPGWTALGCRSDSSDRTLLDSTQVVSSWMTDDWCIRSCESHGYTLAGLEDGNECYCGNEMSSTSTYLASSSCSKACSGNLDSAATCGGAYALTMFSSTPVVTVDPTTVANFSSAGCWQDSATDRVLTGSSSTLGLMTTAQCVSSCSTQGFIYAGLEASFYCYCGNTIASSSLLLAASSCTSPCGGNSTEICGGPSALSIYSTEAVENTDSSNSTWTDEGCWVFNGNDTTTLSGLTTSSSAMTQSLCRSRCDFGGYAFAGLQGDYCYCANTMGVSSVLLSSYCTWQCSGSSTDICGGSGTMSLSRSTSAAAAALPAAPGWTALGCRSDSSDRTLLDSTQVVSSWMTDDWCIRSCESHGYTLAGLEDGNECYCGNEMSSTSTYLASSSCYKTCPGLGSKQCGGAYALTMFSSTPVVTVDPTTVANFSSAGCWQDSATDRVLTGSSSTLGLMTTAQCVSSCSTQGFIYAGLEASFYCYCGNTIASSSLLLAASSCTSPCGGNSTEICGGPSALSIYSTEAVENTDSSNSTWTDEGCWVFNGNDTTTLSGLTTSSSAMTQSLCRSRCDFGGYAFAGLQGDYCYCANTMGVSSVLLSSYCTWQCSGSSTDICGGSGTMSLSRSTSAAAAALPAAPGWTALGCRSDSSDRTLLDSTQVVSSWMTDDWCIRSCESHGYTLAGLEDGNECYCGNEMSSTSTYLASSSCYKTCPGLGSKQCGGAYALTMFQSPSSNNDPVYANATVSQYMSLGCWSDTSDHQTLGASVYSVGVMTHEICLQRCSAQGSTYAGLQGYNCYCGDSLKNSNLLADSSCTTTCGGDDFELCGGYLALTVYGPEQLAAAANSTWTDVGCWLTTINGVSALSGSQTSDGSMTLDLCQSRCAFGGFAFSGVGQYNCYCGDSLSTSTAVDARYCDATCPGDSSKTCGGAYGMSVYRSSTAAVSLPASNTWTSLGCRSDSWTRTLDASTLYSSFAMTLDLCIRTCDSANYTYAGVEDGTECYCGNSVLESSTYLPLSSCTYSCGGFSSSICGGYWALSLYQKSATDTSSVIVNETTTAYSPVGCWSDTTDHTALTGSSYSIGTMTQDTCKQYCSSKGFTYAGVEGFDCFCGNSLAKSNILLDSSCTTSCAGNTTQTCGGSQAMTVFGPYSSEESTDVWSDVGCWITSPIDVPVLNGVSSTYASMTQTLCTKRCESAGYAFAGTSGNTCYCGSSLSSSSDVSSSLCSTACPGDSSESCGGSSAMTVSKSSLFTNVNIPSISGWSDAGCYTDNWDRTLSGDTLTHSLMTPLLCTQYCSSTGYSMAGVEGGTQCYCGSSLNIISTTSLLCSTPCGGLSTALCGGSWAIEVYSPTYTNSTSGHSVPSDIALSNQCLSPAQATARASASATQTTISASASATATGVTRRYNLEDTVGRSYRS